MMPTAPKSVLCIHDLAGAGRCSLSMILPVLAVQGQQGIALPTAILSTHTGGLGQPARLDCTEYGLAALEHYRSLELQFSCIYTGYLGGQAQMELAQRAFSYWPEALKVVDPAMADGGKFYAGMESAFDSVCALSRQADILIPNLSEAHLLLGRDYPEQADFTQDSALELAQALTEYCPQTLVTGIPRGKYLLCAGGGREQFVVEKQRIPRDFHGTGDLFAAILVGGLMRGNALSAAADAAANFVADAISATPEKADSRLGLWYEPLLPRLLQWEG